MTKLRYVREYDAVDLYVAAAGKSPDFKSQAWERFCVALDGVCALAAHGALRDVEAMAKPVIAVDDMKPEFGRGYVRALAQLGPVEEARREACVEIFAGAAALNDAREAAGLSRIVDRVKL